MMKRVTISFVFMMTALFTFVSAEEPSYSNEESLTCDEEICEEVSGCACCDRDITQTQYCCESDCEYARKHNLIGIWLPADCPIFRPFIADPHQITNSTGWRFNDDPFGKNIIDVSYGNILPFYRWCDVWWGGDLEVALEGSLWAVFDPLHESAPLIDADYFVGMSVSYGLDKWAFRFRGYHISTHIGDEFLLNHRHFHRKNPSIEALDWFASYQITRDIRLYGGFGWVCCQDDSFRISPWYVVAGTELRFQQMGYTCYSNRLYGLPFLAMHFRMQRDYKNHVDATYALGYEWGKTCGDCRRFRIFLEYHDGYCAEGQFWKTPSNYFSIRVSYGY